MFKRNLDHLADALQVRGQLNIQLRRLSLGERMKMELIAALLHEPKVVFLDEPTIGLDLNAQRSIRDFLLEYRRQHQPAMIVTSHYMEDIERLCERIIIIREGQFVYDGPLGNVVKRFAGFKVITAHLDKDADLSATATVLAGEEVVSASAENIKVKVARERIPSTCAMLLKAFPIVDLSIEEEDIGNIISSLLRDKP